MQCMLTAQAGHRQGDAGSSRYFLSLEDNMFRVFGGERIRSLMSAFQIDDLPMESKMLVLPSPFRSVHAQHRIRECLAAGTSQMCGCSLALWFAVGSRLGKPTCLACNAHSHRLHLGIRNCSQT